LVFLLPFPLGLLDGLFALLDDDGTLGFPRKVELTNVAVVDLDGLLAHLLPVSDDDDGVGPWLDIERRGRPIGDGYPVEKDRMARFDPTKPAGARWALLERNREAPSAKFKKRYESRDRAPPESYARVARFLAGDLDRNRFEEERQRLQGSHPSS